MNSKVEIHFFDEVNNRNTTKPGSENKPIRKFTERLTKDSENYSVDKEVTRKEEVLKKTIDKFN